MTRPSFEDIYMAMAGLLSQRSTCSRLKVGCVITSSDHRQVYAVGYNGGASGQSNECESLEPGLCGHLHAEVNAAINCHASRYDGKAVYITDLPCPMCAKVLVNLGGVCVVYYGRDYRNRAGLGILTSANIRHVQLK